MHSSRAQSETLGFVLVFALMVASIGIVYTAGFSGLQDVRDAERVNNAERAFEVLADNMEDITQRGAPSRATELRLADASLDIAEPITIRVNNSDTGLDAAYSVRPISYDADTGDQLVYVQGALIRVSGDSALMTHESPMLINQSRTIIPIIETKQSGTASIGGSTTVLIRANHAITSLVYENIDPPSPVWFNVTSPRAGVWAEHLESKSGVSNCDLTGDTAACQIDTEQIFITRVQIEMYLE